MFCETSIDSLLCEILTGEEVIWGLRDTWYALSRCLWCVRNTACRMSLKPGSKLVSVKDSKKNEGSAVVEENWPYVRWVVGI